MEDTQLYGWPVIIKTLDMWQWRLLPLIPVMAWASLRLWKTSSNELALGQEKIVICDLGESFNPHKLSRYSSKTLPLLQPPETRFSNEPLSFPSDIWTLGCTIWEILGHRSLFEAYFPSADRVTKEQVEVFGKLPSEWWKIWSKKSDWFDEDGVMKTASWASA